MSPFVHRLTVKVAYYVAAVWLLYDQALFSNSRPLFRLGMIGGLFLSVEVSYIALDEVHPEMLCNAYTIKMRVFCESNVGRQK